jgi:hypothetical protein
MLRYITLASIAVLMFSLSLANAQANQQEMRERQCRYQWVDKGTWTPKEEARTARCVVERWSVPGGLSTFDAVISCESGWNRLAYNSGGPYVGLAQHALSSWSSRVRTYTPSFWHLFPGWRNSRTMLTITARMMNAEGLSAWGCA